MLERKNPHRLLDFLIEKFKFRNDAELCRHLDVPSPIISRIRSGKRSLGDGLRVAIMERCGMTLDQVRAAAGETPHRTNFCRGSISLLFIMKSDGFDGTLYGNGGLGDLAGVSDSHQELEAMHAEITSNLSDDRKDGLIVDYDSFEIQQINRRRLGSDGSIWRSWEYPKSKVYANAQSKAAILELQRLVKERG